ncbi:hypothetical protein [Sphingomonas bacterium]|uniref:hypothetical protein n=1 Tax=Sphingomonas bacterium TaxID=1895847 RepID=UPI00260F716C|nr:hypothetical protein [Sphingomonas bacterium]MDB5678518.1 hypothetical protein [Sphingomonas bacterium]
MTAMLALQSPDTITHRMMIALELVDPVTGRAAGQAMRVHAPDFRPATVTRAGQIVWIDTAPSEPRKLVVEAVADRGQFAPYADILMIPPRLPGAAAIVHRVTLTPTGLYQAPPGRLSVAGMLIDTVAARQPLAGAKVRIWLQSRNDAAVLDSNYEGLSDDRGGFVAVVGDLGGDTPMLLKPPAPDGGLVGWLAVTVGATTRHSPLLPLRQSRPYRAPAPFAWADLAPNPPALPI